MNGNEKVIPERDPMGLAQALIYLYKMRVFLPDDSDLSRALDAVFRFIDEESLSREFVLYKLHNKKTVSGSDPDH